MARFHYQKLAVSEEAFTLVLLVDGLASKFERKRYYLADQIRRAALSVLLNIGEAAAEFNPAEKARIFGLARRSAEEVAIGLAVSVRLNLLSDELISASIEQAGRVNGMLTGLIVYHRNQSAKNKGASRKPSRHAPEESSQ